MWQIHLIQHKTRIVEDTFSCWGKAYQCRKGCMNILSLVQMCPFCPFYWKKYFLQDWKWFHIGIRLQWMISHSCLHILFSKDTHPSWSCQILSHGPGLTLGLLDPVPSVSLKHSTLAEVGRDPAHLETRPYATLAPREPMEPVMMQAGPRPLLPPTSL